jgi:hypothetical protein
MEPWYDGYDPCVLLENGLRMIGSKKAEPCPTCRGECVYKRGKKTTSAGPNAASADKLTPDDVGGVCETCQSVGRLDKGRPYRLVMVVDRDGNPIPEAIEYYGQPQNAADLVKFLSIRCPPNVPEYATSAKISFPDEATKKRLVEAATIDRRDVRKQKKPAAAAKTPAQIAEDRDRKRDELVDVPGDDPIFDALSKFVIGEFRGAPIVTRIKRTASKDCYIANTHCHFCENKVLWMLTTSIKLFIQYTIGRGACPFMRLLYRQVDGLRATLLLSEELRAER